MCVCMYRCMLASIQSRCSQGAVNVQSRCMCRSIHTRIHLHTCKHTRSPSWALPPPSPPPPPNHTHTSIRIYIHTYSSEEKKEHLTREKKKKNYLGVGGEEEGRGTHGLCIRLLLRAGGDSCNRRPHRLAGFAGSCFILGTILMDINVCVCVCVWVIDLMIVLNGRNGLCLKRGVLSLLHTIVFKTTYYSIHASQYWQIHTTYYISNTLATR